MTNLQLNFTFYGGDVMPTMSNDTLFLLRKEVAEMMEHAGFGEVQTLPNDRFENPQAIPITDNFFAPENDLFIAYQWHYPIREGDIGYIVTEGIPHLLDFIHDIHTDLSLLVRLIFN